MKDLIACLYSKGWTFSKLKQLSNQLDLPKCPGNFFDFCKKYNVKYLVWDEVFLKKTRPLPYVLYYQWNISLVNKKIIWIVWPRKITTFIKLALKKFFNFLDWKDVVVVSGFAFWTDQYAHKLALKHNIPTIAVLGFGFKKAVVSADRHFLNEIVEKNWLVLSEFRLDQLGANWTFPQRNRIIAGLSDFLFVPQAAKNSWTLITVENAIDFKIPVYSCFSSYDEESGRWTNQLISDGKINWIYDFELFLKEISEKFWLERVWEKVQLELSLEEEQIIKILKSWKNSLEEIVMELGLIVPEVLNILSEMELKGLIYERVGKYYTK